MGPHVGGYVHGIHGDRCHDAGQRVQIRRAQAGGEIARRRFATIDGDWVRIGRRGHQVCAWHIRHVAAIFTTTTCWKTSLAACTGATSVEAMFTNQ
jgi:hypothetical protein